MAASPRNAIVAGSGRCGEVVVHGSRQQPTIPARRRRASAAASGDSLISGGWSRHSSQGTTIGDSRPGSPAAPAHIVRVIFTPAVFSAISAISGFAAIDVRNIAERMMVA